jgi:hypothetical protein
LEDTGVDGRIILKWIFDIIFTFIFDKWAGGVDWFDLAQDRASWWAVVNAVMNLWVYKMREIS